MHKHNSVIRGSIITLIIQKTKHWHINLED